jgi:cytochrome d ubiquinol oxidase subunit I
MGIWIFGWDRLPKNIHLASIWLVALGANISALWILIANSFMQEPVGYVIRHGRAELANFFAIVSNPHVWVQWPHVFTSALTTAAFFILAISAWHLLKANGDVKMFKRSFEIASITAIIATIAVAVVGHAQAQHMIVAQPMKMAAAEALWDTEDPAFMSLLTIGNEPERRDVFAIRVPGLLSLLAYNRADGAVPGINELQASYEAAYGPGNYVPPVALSYWTFRIMVGLGMVMIVLAIIALYTTVRGDIETRRRLLSLLPYTIILPYAANTTGWLFTEVGRQPWLVFGLMTLEEGISPIPVSSALFSLIAYFVVISGLVATSLYLMNK